MTLDSRFPPKARDAPCCSRLVDDHGRYPIGFCSPTCLRRKPIWRGHVALRRAETADRWRRSA